MQEEIEQQNNNEISAEVELTEADYFDEEKRAQAIAELMAPFREREERRANLVRPKISVLRAVLNALLPLVVAAGIFCALYFTLPQHALGIALGVSLGLLGLYFLIRLRALLIWCILVYQAKAPDDVRLRCVYTPSCSEYAIAALKKYGVIRGVVKIIKRLWRCHPPNGGIDELK